MTRDEYEERRRRIEEQHRSAVELLETALRQQIRALDLVWTTSEEMVPNPVVEGSSMPPPSVAASPTPAPPAAPLPPPRPERRPMYRICEDVRAALPSLPEEFTRDDVLRVLGYEPDRAVLFRVFERLLEEGHIRLTERGSG